jgi:hypothetical protein
MKTVNASFFQSDGEWWFRQKGGTRQRAKVRDCETCGSRFASFPSSKTKFCSAECRRTPCRRCGKVINVTGANSRYCSSECKQGSADCMNCNRRFVIGKKAAGKFCSIACFNDFTCPVGSIRNDSGGYTIIKVPNGTPGTKRVYGPNRTGWMWTHRYVMQEKLGRPLLKTERVHHINGKRDDNRPENLELWKRSHPAGVRAADYHCAGCRCFEPGFKCE